MPSDDDVNQIASQLFCPVCENVPLDECPTEACAQWRELIRQKLAQGLTEQEIKDFFIAQYGDQVLGDPPMRGFNWLLYIFPLSVILVGSGLIVVRLKRGHKMQPTQAYETTDPYLEQVERDLKKLKDLDE